jgi:hypothetical protein
MVQALRNSERRKIYDRRLIGREIRGFWRLLVHRGAGDNSQQWRVHKTADCGQRSFRHGICDFSVFHKWRVGLGNGGYHVALWQWKQVHLVNNLLFNFINSFGQNGNSIEFWVALIEKAYSKLHGCYENIIDKSFVEGLVDLTGGLGEKIVINDYENQQKIQTLWQTLLYYFNMKFQLGCINRIPGKVNYLNFILNSKEH